MGATGTVGRTVLEVLDDLDVPVKALRPFASPRSAGTTLSFRDDDLRVEALREGAFRGCDVAILRGRRRRARVGAEGVRRGVPRRRRLARLSRGGRRPARRRGGERRRRGAGAARHRREPVLHRDGARARPRAAPRRGRAPARRRPTYHSASGLGQGGVEELERQARDLLNLREPDPAARFPHRLAFNVIPQVGAFVDGGATDEEAKIVSETRKVLGDPALAIAATAVRVPVFFGHSLAVNLATDRPLGAAGARAALAKAPGVKVVDDPAQRVYPMPLLVGSEDAALVGRLRDDPTQEHGLSLFVSIENTRKGAATNAVQLAQLLAPRPA